MNKTFEITATLERLEMDCATIIRITWNTKANDMREALSKVRAYIHEAEEFEQAICIWIGIEEVKMLNSSPGLPGAR